MVVDMSDNADEDFKPTLFDVHNVLEEKIVGEHQSRMALFTTYVLADRNVLIQGQRSTGKSFISDDVAKKFLGMRKSFSGDDTGNDSGKCYAVTMGSDKSAWYQVEQINSASHILIYEMNQMPKTFLEVLKKWGEGKEATYKVTQNVGGIRGIKSYVLYPRPFALCLADEEELIVDEQFQSRITIIRTDNSIEQTDAIKMRQAELAKNGHSTIKIDESLLENLRIHVTTLPPFKSLKYIHPAADLFVDVVPSLFADARRDFPKYIDNASGIARFYWKERIIVINKAKDRIMLLTPQDMYLNHIIYGQVAIESSLKCSSMERTMIEIIRILNRPVKAREVQQQLRKNEMNVSVHMVNRHLSKLADIGYIEREKKGQITYYEAGEVFDNINTHIDWKEVIKACDEYIKTEYPSIYEKYKARYIDKPIIKHPFSGQDINLLEIEPDKQPEATKVEQLPSSDLNDYKPTIGQEANDYEPPEEEIIN